MDTKSIRKDDSNLLTSLVSPTAVTFFSLFFLGVLIVNACADSGYIEPNPLRDDKQNASSTSVFAYYHLYRDLSQLPKYEVASSSNSGDDYYGETRYQESKAWIDERNKVLSTEHRLAYYYSWDGCIRPSYSSALTALQQREKIYGGTEIEEWILDRERAWGGCSGIAHEGDSSYGNGTPRIDALLLAKEKDISGRWYTKLSSYFVRFFKKSNDLNEKVVFNGRSMRKDDLKKQDLVYHLAIAYFYANDFDQAEKKLKLIAKDSTSVWQKDAKLSLGRVYIKKAQASFNLRQEPLLTSYLYTDPQSEKMADDFRAQMKIAYNYFVALRKDSQMADRSSDIDDFIDFTYSRVDPLGRLMQISQQLSQKNVTQDVVKKLLPDLHQVDDVANRTETGDDLLDWIMVTGAFGSRPGSFYDTFDKPQYLAKSDTNKSENFQRLFTLIQKNFNKKHNSVWAYAVIDLASKEESFDDKQLVKSALVVLDEKRYISTASDAVLEKIGRLIVRHPSFLTKGEIAKYYALIFQKALVVMSGEYLDRESVFPHLAFLMAQTPAGSGNFITIQYFSTLPLSVLMEIYPSVPPQKAKRASYEKDTKNYLALEIFRRSGKIEDWQMATKYAKVLTWPDTSYQGSWSNSDDDEKVSHQNLLQKFIDAPDDVTKKFVFISLTNTKSEMWRSGVSLGSAEGSDSVGTSKVLANVPLFLTGAMFDALGSEKSITEVSTQDTVGRYLMSLDYTTIAPSYQYLIPQAMSDYVMLVTRYSYDDKGKEYSKKVFDRLHRDFPDSQAAKDTKFYY